MWITGSVRARSFYAAISHQRRELVAESFRRELTSDEDAELRRLRDELRELERGL